MPKPKPITPEMWDHAKRVYEATGIIDRAARESGIHPSTVRYNFNKATRDWHRQHRKSHRNPYIKKPEENVLLDAIQQGKDRVINEYHRHFTKPLAVQHEYVENLIKQSKERLASYNGEHNGTSGTLSDDNNGVLVLNPAYDASTRTFFFDSCELKVLQRLESPTIRGLIEKAKTKVKTPINVPGYFPLSEI